ncbi:hypothetical protein ACFL3T_02610 [Patescibacteria group bacterium]
MGVEHKDNEPTTNQDRERIRMISEVEAIIIVFKQSTQQLLGGHKNAIKTVERLRKSLIRKCGEVYLALDKDSSVFDEVNRIMMNYFEFRSQYDAEKLRREVLKKIGDVY